MRPDTDCAALLRAYVRAWPAWLGGYDESRRWGFKFHTQSQRSGDLGSKHGFPVVSRRRAGEDYHEYRLKDEATYRLAALAVELWDIDAAIERGRAQGALALTGGGA